MASTDQWGNHYYPPLYSIQQSTAPTWGTTSTNTNISSTVWTTTGAVITYPTVVPSHELLKQPGVMEEILDHLATIVKPGEKVVICVDSDMSTSQVNDIVDMMSAKGMPGLLIRGARAGTGFAGNFQTPEEERIDILARIGAIWALRPDLKLTDLLQWFRGESMEDREFAAALEVYFMKLTNGVHGSP
jgi:hypothetical protein